MQQVAPANILALHVEKLVHSKSGFVDRARFQNSFCSWKLLQHCCPSIFHHVLFCFEHLWTTCSTHKSTVSGPPFWASSSHHFSSMFPPVFWRNHALSGTLRMLDEHVHWIALPWWNLRWISTSKTWEFYGIFKGNSCEFMVMNERNIYGI